jgi:hypothetical protein
MKIVHQLPNRLPKCRAVIHCWAGRYERWTGFEWFGVITAYRYFGWQVTCWAQVAATVFPLRQTAFFARLEDAVDVLDRLMDRAEEMDQLTHEPVCGVLPPHFWGSRFEFINPMLISDSRVPESPAHRRRLFQRFPPDQPLTKRQQQNREWACSPAPAPELFL